MQRRSSEGDRQLPLNDVGCLSYLTVGWVTSTMWKAFRVTMMNFTRMIVMMIAIVTVMITMMIMMRIPPRWVGHLHHVESLSGWSHPNAHFPKPDLTQNFGS